MRLRHVLIVVGTLVFAAGAIALGVQHWIERPAGERAQGLPEVAPPSQVRVQVPTISLQPFVKLRSPITSLAVGPGGKLLVTEKRGRVMLIEGGAVLEAPLLDIRSLVEARGSEQGLLSAVVGRDSALYVNYTSRRGDGDTVVARYRPDGAGVFSAASGETLLTIEQPATNHNGGQLQIGPEGMLYIGMGDGGLGHDPWGNAQDLEVLLGKLLRIDVSARSGYQIPASNPFVGRQGRRGEIWAYGLRNPWRFSFDRMTGDLFIADVGQNSWEEIDFVAAGSRGGHNFGWDALEGLNCHEPANGCDAAGTVAPIAVYGRDQGCSVTGGYVYRGTRHADLIGWYLYGDYCTGRIWGLRRDARSAWQNALLVDTDVSIASFGEDAQGEIYVLDLNGSVFQI